MPIISNVNGIGKIMLGSSSEIVRVYLGTAIVYENSQPNKFVFNVSANQTIVLQNDTRGAKVTTVDWGDGTKNSSLSHTYTTAGYYTVTTTYSVVASTATVEKFFYDFGHSGENRLVPAYDENTARSLVEVIQVCGDITKLDYMFYQCTQLAMNKINLDNIDPSKYNSAVEMFWLTGYNAYYSI